MPYIDQLRMPRNSYTGHKIPKIPIDIGQLCVSYVIDSSLARNEYANLQKIRFLCTAKGSLSKVMNRFMRQAERGFAAGAILFDLGGNGAFWKKRA